jgi:hypothetical protein
MTADPALSWPIAPGRGVGPLRVGMPVGAAVRALEDAGLGPVEQARKGWASIYASHAGTVRLVPGPPPQADGRVPKAVAEIELVLLRSVPPDQQPRAELLGRNLLGEPLGDIQEFLFAVDARAERRGHLVEAPGLGIRVWSGGSPPRWPVDSVTITRPAPPARVIAPSFAYATLDRIARDFGFTGGATTVRAPLVAGEPEVAEWSRRHILLRYTFDPVTFLRVIYLDDPEAADAPVVQRLLARLPVVSAEQVLGDLASNDDETVLRAIQAVSALRLTAARVQLRRLSQETGDPLRSAAVSALISLPDLA